MVRKKNKKKVGVNLEIKYTEKYPETEPIVYIKSKKGINKEKIDEMNELVEKVFQEYKNEILVFQIIQEIQEYLLKNNDKLTEELKEQEELKEFQKRKQEEEENMKSVNRFTIDDQVFIIDGEGTYVIYKIKKR
jgi:hypothetical protein